MYLFEAIKIKNKKIYNLELHNKRLNESRKALFNTDNYIDLTYYIDTVNLDNDIYKCRIIYEKEIKKIEFINYYFRKINSLKIVFSNDIEYSYKYENKIIFEPLLKQKNNCDDILIIKNNKITDTSFSNVALFDGIKWMTPSTPLLKGTKREFYLQNGVLKEEEIYYSDLKKFKKLTLINCMIDLEDNVTVDIRNIY